MKELGVLEKSTRKECVAETVKSPITTEKYDLFTAMIPSEGKRMLFPTVVRKNWEYPKEK